MRSTPRARAGALLIALALLPARVAAQATDPLAPLAWMAGCWELRAPTRLVREQWMAPAGGVMLGMSRTLVRGAAREFEFLRIVLRDSTPTYLAQPGGGAPTAFAAVLVSDTAVLFANPAHDFPQRIGYRPVGRDSLVAHIEGTAGERRRRMEFPMQRVGCGG